MDGVDLWLVTWKYDYRTHCLDAETQELAESLAIRLAEAGRSGVRITPHEMEIDPEHMAAVKARVWAAVKAHAFASTVGEAMREAAG